MAAAHTVAAARCTTGRCGVWLFLYVLCFVLCAISQANNIFSRHDLLKIGVSYRVSVSTEFIHSHKIPEEVARRPGAPWITIPEGRRRRRRRERRRKRGCRAGVLTRLRRKPFRPPLPSLYLSNVRSLANKMDELRLQITTDNRIKNSCILLITESWLHQSIPDSAIELAGYTVQRQDRTNDSESDAAAVDSAVRTEDVTYGEIDIKEKQEEATIKCTAAVLCLHHGSR